MLAHPTQERLLALGLTGMAKALDDQRRQPDIAALAFEERLALLLDRETIERENKRLVARLRFAALRQEAVVEDVDLRAPRGLDRTPLTGEQRRDLLEIMDDRHERGSTIVTSQVPVDHWHQVIGDPTIADAVLDRLVHNAHRLLLNGESRRKRAANALMIDAEAVN